MTSSVISSRLSTVLVRICDAANKHQQIHKSYDDALMEVASYRPESDFALCEVDLNYNFLYKGDILVGFRAYTDASFTIVIKDKIRIPFIMKAGEFHLAWKNISFIPGICIQDTIEVENVKGNVMRIMAYLNTRAIHELRHIPKFYLEPTWVIKDKQLCNIDAYNEDNDIREVHTDKCPCVIQ